VTNHEKIKAMSVEELAKFIGYKDEVCETVSLDDCHGHPHCCECTLKFLLQEAEE
jgi:hypothetical protein